MLGFPCLIKITNITENNYRSLKCLTKNSTSLAKSSIARRGVVGLRVEAWDKDLIFDDLVGSAVTDQQGVFIIEFTESYFREFFWDRRPDIFFKVYRAEELMASTEDSVLWNHKSGESHIIIEVDVPIEAPKPFVVKGQIRQADGSLLVGGLVRAFDKDLRHEQLLGEQGTDTDGRYEIRYSRAMFRRAEKKNADLIVRIFDRQNEQLIASPVIFNAQPEETVNLVIGGGEFLGESEYEQLMMQLAPLLDGIQIAEMNQEDIVFLTGETGLEPLRLAFMVISHRLASKTDLPAEAFYGFCRQQLPTSLLPLLAYLPETWREALETALDKNIVPTTLRSRIDAIINRLQQLASEESGGKPGSEPQPIQPRLDINRLDHSVLDNLRAGGSSKAYINKSLNDTLRGMLAEVLAKHGFSALAAFCQTMSSVDLATHAETTLRAFMQTEVANYRRNDSGMALILQESVDKLSTTTRIGQLLGLEQQIQNHPLFQPDANRLKFNALLDTAPILATQQLQDAFISRYAGREGTIEEFWKGLRQDPDFQADGVVEDVQFTLQLSLLTQHYTPLVHTLQKLRQQGEVQTTRDLAKLDLDTWKTLIRSTLVDEIVPIPNTIPGINQDEKIDNYAKSILAVIERAFPTDFVAQGMAKAPEIDLSIVRQVLAQYPNLDLRQPLPDKLDLSDLSSPESAKAALETLRQELNQFPDLDYHNLPELSDEPVIFSNLIRQHVAKFFSNAPDFDFQTTRVAPYLAEHAETAFQGIAESDQAAVTTQLKRLQRMFQVTPRYAHIKTLMSEGLDSAYSITSIPPKTFKALMADRLGGETVAHGIYSSAMEISSTTLQLFSNSYQARYDAIPFVMGGGDLGERIKLKETIKTSPTLTTLFGSLELCDCEHCQSLYSPSAYFVDLLQFLNPKPSFSNKKPLNILLKRRPDLTHIMLSCDNAMTPLPYVDLVNEVLEYYVAYGELNADTAKNTKNITADELKANPQYTIDEAYDHLKSANYPPSLPYNRNVETARVYLEHLGSSRHEVMDLFRHDQTDTTQRAVDAEFLKITAEEYRILTGKNFDDVNSSIQLHTLFGYESEHITLYIENISETKFWWQWRVNVPSFLQRNGLNYLELIEIIKTQFVNPEPESETAIILYTPPDSQCELAVTYIQHADDSGLDAPTQVKINRFIRLWRKLGWPLQDLDKAAKAFQATDITPNFIQQLALVQQLQTELKTPLVQLLSLWANIDTHGDDSLYVKLFLNKAARDIDEAFQPKLYGTNDITDHISTLLAAFRISAADLDLIRYDAELAAEDAKLTLENVSKIYRYTVLAKAMRWKIEDLITFKTLSGQEPFQTPDNTAYFISLAQNISNSAFSLAQLNYIYRHVSEPPTGLAPQRDNLLLLVKNLRSGLVQIAEENVLIPDSTGDFTREKLAMLFEGDIADRTVQMVLDTVAIQRAELDALPDIEFTNQFARRISHDPSSQELLFTGLMTTTERNELLALSGDASYQIAIGQIHKKAEDFIQQSSLFIESTLKGILEPSDAITKLLNTSVKDELNENGEIDIVIDPDGIARKFTYILEWLIPYLRDRLSRSMVKQALSEATNLESETMDLLLEKLLPSRNEPQKFAIDDVLALSTPGLTASYFDYDAPYLKQAKEIVVVPEIASILMPAWTRSARWQGMLLAPESGDYTFYISTTKSTNATSRLWIDEQFVVETTPISLKAGQLYSLRLEMRGIETNTTATIELYWQSATLPKHIVPRDNLYPASIFDTFSLTFTLLHKNALLIDGFKLAAHEIVYLLDNNQYFDNLSFSDFPLEHTNNSDAFKQWQRLNDYVVLRDSLPNGEVSLIEVFETAAMNANPNTVSQATLDKLIAATGWDAKQIGNLSEATFFALTDTDLRNEIQLVRLQAALRLSKKLGISVATLFAWAAPEAAPAQAIKNAVRAKYDEEAWIALAKPLNDKLRESQKAALIDYVLAQKTIQDQGIENASQLLEYFLIDVNMNACMMTSRLKQAIASVQLFVQRCLMNLESEVEPIQIDDEQWEWMKCYRVWEANRKVFLYPENWIEPELRDNKSPFFKELESELLQNDLTPEYVEKVFLHYLEKLDEVARLDICGMYWEDEKNDRSIGDEIMHVFGRTFSPPHIYYYRKWSNRTSTWTAWEKVNLNIDSPPEGDGIHLIPVVFNRRLYLFWPIFTEKPDEDQPSEEGQKPKTHWEIQLAWSEYWDNKWLPKRVSKAIQSESAAISISPSYFTFFSMIFDGELMIDCCYWDFGNLVYLISCKMLSCKEEMELKIQSEGYVTYPGPKNTHIDYMRYERSGSEYGWNDENSKILELKLATNEAPHVILQHTFNKLNVLHSHTKEHLETHVYSHFFYQDQQHTYFVRPVIEEEPQLKLPDRVKPPEDYEHLYPDPKEKYDPVGPRILPAPIDEMIFDEPVTIITNAPIIAGTPQVSATANSINHAVTRSLEGDEISLQTTLRDNMLADFNVIEINMLKVEKLKFEIHYHPYVCHFISSLKAGGIPALLTTVNQRLGTLHLPLAQFNIDYRPTDRVAKPYPRETVDFDGAYSLYNWELFFHIPLLIATRLMQDQRFSEAQKWFHYIFNPTDSSKPDSQEKPWSRYWKVLKFRDTEQERLEDFFEYDLY